MTRPHILLIVSDQHSPKVMGCAGDPHIRTPQLDRLAAGGTLFTNAYCASPLCGPSRASMMTGLLPVRTGVEMNADSLPSSLPTFAHALTVQGYQTILCGRMHFVGPDQRHGFRERLVGDYGPTDLAQRMHDMGIFKDTTGQDARRLPESSGPGLSDVMLYDEEVTEAACRRINEHSWEEHPLFMTVGFYGPHNPYVCPPELFDHYHSVLPEIPQESVEAYYESAHPAMRKWIEARHLRELEPAVRHAGRAGYYGLIEKMDGLIGTLVETARGTFGDNLLIIYTSDHGDMAGEKGLFWKSNFHEGSVGVPWIWSGPGIVRDRVIHESVSLLDLAPTLADLSGFKEWPDGDGISLVPAIRGEQTPPPERPIISTLVDRQRGVSAMVRKGRYKLIRHHGFERAQLFDLATDPEEETDLGAEPGFKEIIQDLTRSLEGGWEPARARRHASGSPARLKLFRKLSQTAGESNSEQWPGDPSRLWFQKPDQNPKGPQHNPV